MRLVEITPARSVERSRSAARSVTALLVCAFVVMASAAAATASSDVRASAAAGAGSPFCGLSSKFASTALSPTSSLVPNTAATSISTLESRMKIEFETFKSEEPALLASAPSQIKADLVKVFAVDDKLVGVLEKANFNFMALAPYAKSLEAEAATIKPDIAALSGYFKTSCGFKVK